jgi:hypothetical protein
MFDIFISETEKIIDSLRLNDLNHIDYKTYIDQELKFHFKYPQNFNLIRNTPDITMITNKLNPSESIVITPPVHANDSIESAIADFRKTINKSLKNDCVKVKIKQV